MQNLQDILDQIVKKTGAAGAQLSVVSKGRQTDVASGLRDHNLGLAMTVETNVQVGSVTKVLNAALVLECAAKRGADIDAPILQWLPNLKLSDPDATARMTLRHLLSMSSGLDNGDYGDYGMDEGALERRVKQLAFCPQHFTPGKYFGYSNASTDLSGYVAQSVAGRAWDDLLQELVVQPLRLQNTATRDGERHLDRLSRGHIFDAETGGYSYIEDDYFSAGSAPAGSMTTSTAQDLAAFGQALLGGYLDASNSVFTPQTAAGLFERQIDVPVKAKASYWCLGLSIVEWGDTEVWWHAGGNKCGCSWLFIVPTMNLVVACTINTTNTNKGFYQAIIDELFPKIAGITPLPPSLSTLPAETLDKYCGAYGSMTGELVVEKRGGGLRLVNSHHGGGGLMRTMEGDLIPIEEGRFWLKGPQDESPTNDYEEIAFFGSDENGRTSNAIVGYFAFSRAHVGASQIPSYQPAP